MYVCTYFPNTVIIKKISYYCRLSASMSTEGGPLCSVGVDALKYPPVNPPPFTCNICQGEGLEDQANDSGVPILGAWIQR